jgi:hypothetical protein
LWNYKFVKLQITSLWKYKLPVCEITNYKFVKLQITSLWNYKLQVIEIINYKLMILQIKSYDFEVRFSYLLMHPLLLTSTFSINFLCTPSIFILCCSTFLLTHYKKLYDVSTVIPLKHIVKSSVKHHNH